MPGVLESRYVVGERLGGDPSGGVYRAVGRNGGPDRAVKILRPPAQGDPAGPARLAQARSLMLAMKGRHVVNVEDLIVDGDEVAIVMELVDGGDLRSYIECRAPLSELHALTLTRQILLGLATMHGRGITHGDIRPEKVLLADGPGTATITAKVE